jgi:2-oxoglutarate dehydrogenase E2 component (dihydrolipoamide succinyltransferase)
MIDIVVPALGESVSEATVGKWRRKAGEAVAKDEVLVELETDKVALEVSAPEAGVLSDIVAAEGANVQIGALLGRIAEKGATAQPAGKGSGGAKGAAAPAPAAPAAATASGSASGATLEVTVPTMGESVAEGTLAKWLKKPGEAVKAGDPIAEIETDKVAVEIPAPADGAIAQTLVAEGTTVKPGQAVARFAAGAGAAGAPAQPAQAQTQAPAATPAPARGGAGEVMPPSVQRIVAENRLEPASIAGSGRDGRITKGDALAAINAAPVAVATAVAQPAAPRALDTREERVPMTRLRQTIARRLKEAQNNAAMLTTFNEADMTAVMAFRTRFKDAFEKRHGVKLGFMSFFVKACVAALQDVPAVNAEIDGTDIIYKNFYDIGVAVGTDRGLVVPVLRDADTRSLAEIEKGIAELGAKARDGQLSMADMQGATFTISNGGVYGSLMSTPILNAPQSGILGMHKIQDRPMALNGQVVIRPMMYLALSYDHRIVDGKEAVTFLVRVKENLEDPERLLLDV